MLSCFPLILSQIHLARVRFGIKVNIQNILPDKKKKKKNARTISNNDKVYRHHIKIESFKSTFSSKIFLIENEFKTLKYFL